MGIKTYFCTLNWNTTEWLARMVESVEKTTPEPHTWVIVDNGSDEANKMELLDWSHNRFGTLWRGSAKAGDDIVVLQSSLGVLIESATNLGCVKGYNLAFDLVDDLQGDDPCQIVMINTDVTLHGDRWLSRAMDWLEGKSKIGIVGFEHSKGAKCASPIFLDQNGGWYVHDRQNMSEVPQEGESVGLGFALLRWPVVEAGLRFDTLYEMYYKQDDDLIFQMRSRLGLQAWVFPVDCVHHGRTSIKANDYQVGDAHGWDEFDLMKQENQRRFAKKWAWALRPRRRSMAEEARHLSEMRQIMAERDRA